MSSKLNIIGVVENVIGPSQTRPGGDWRLNVELVEFAPDEPAGGDQLAEPSADDAAKDFPRGNRAACRLWIPSRNRTEIEGQLLPVVFPGDVLVTTLVITKSVTDDYRVMDVGARIRKRHNIVFPAQHFQNVSLANAKPKGMIDFPGSVFESVCQKRLHFF